MPPSTISGMIRTTEARRVDTTISRKLAGAPAGMLRRLAMMAVTTIRPIPASTPGTIPPMNMRAIDTLAIDA